MCRAESVIHHFMVSVIIVMVYLTDNTLTASNCTTNCRETFLMGKFKTYDSRIAPNFENDKQMTVNTSIYVLSIDSISEMGMEYWMSMYLRQTWHDHRLAFNGAINDTELTLDATIVGLLWVPDMFFSNEKSGYFHSVTKPNRLVRLSSDGAIFYSSRLTLKVSCPMALHNFPLDTQICDLNIESYGYSKDKLNLQWSEDIAAVEVDPDLTLPQYKLILTENEYCDKTYSTGTFSCMRLRFHLKRDLGFYMIQTYVPSVLIVILSWVSFWISPDSVPARISLGVLCVLTMTTQSAGIRQTLPRVSYIKAIDVWMSTCLLFVFAALLEFAIVNVFSRRQIKQPNEKTTQTEIKFSLDEVGEREGTDSPQENNTTPEKKTKKKNKTTKYMLDPRGIERARFVDAVSRKIFPGVFTAFNIAYWVVYILSSLEPGNERSS